MTKSIKNKSDNYKVFISELNNWIKNKGMDLANANFEELNFELPTPVSTFKERANEIKNKYNHSFSYPVEYHLKGMATLERFITNQL